MYNIDDNIAAIASGYGQSGIGIIRISGPEALNIVSKIFRPKNKKVDVYEVIHSTLWLYSGRRGIGG